MTMQSMMNGLKVLEALASRQPAGVSSLARELDLPKSTVQRCLLTLEQAGWILPSPDGGGQWSLTLRALSFGRHGSPELSLRDAALPEMRALAASTDETVYLTVKEGDGAVLVERLDSTQAVRTYLPLGTRSPLHGPSTGKAILAALPDADVEAYIAAGLERFTDRTKAPAKLRAELARVREDGYAVNIGEWRPEVAGIGSAICNRKGFPIAAVSVSLPVVRFRAEDVPRIGACMAAAARQIQQRLQGEHL